MQKGECREDRRLSTARRLSWLAPRVPTSNNAGLGPSAIASEPVMEMLFVGAGSLSDKKLSPEAFDWKLFVIRKEATHSIRSKL